MFQTSNEYVTALCAWWGQKESTQNYGNSLGQKLQTISPSLVDSLYFILFLSQIQHETSCSASSMTDLLKRDTNTTTYNEYSFGKEKNTNWSKERREEQTWRVSWVTLDIYIYICIHCDKRHTIILKQHSCMAFWLAGWLVAWF